MALFTVTNDAGSPRTYNSYITGIQQDPKNGNLFVYGHFTAYGNTPANGTISVSSVNGDVNETFDYGSGYGGNFAFQFTGYLYHNSQLYTGGFFNSFNGTPANRIVSLNLDGTINNAFSYGSGFNSWSLKPSTDGNYIYYPGLFSAYNGTGGVNRIVKLNFNGVLDPSFNAAQTGFNNTTIQIVPDGKGYIYVHGYFTAYNGSPEPNFVKISTVAGAKYPGFDVGTGPNIAGVNQPMAMDLYQNYIYIVGHFTEWNGNVVNHIECIHQADGTVVPSFDQGTGFNGIARYISIDRSTGNMLVSGDFTEYKGVPNSRSVILDSKGDIFADVQVPNGFGFEAAYWSELDNLWYCAANNYGTGEYYLVKVYPNGTREFI